MKTITPNSLNEILIISLSNIGDVILTFPVIDVLRNDFRDANLHLVVGPKALSLVKDNPIFKQVHCFNKKDSAFKKFQWIQSLRSVSYDLIVDLRNTAIPLLLPHRHRTSIFKTNDKNVHMKLKHLNRLLKVYPFATTERKKCALYISRRDREYVEQFLQKEVKANGEKSFVVIAPGAANHDKRWTVDGYKKLCEQIYKKYHLKIVLVGDKNDKEVAVQIMDQLTVPVVSGCGRLTLIHLAYLMEKCRMVVCNDSSPMHLASYLNLPVVAIFGPSNPIQYGPWSGRSAYVKKEVLCPRCQNPKLNQKHICIESDPDDVINQVDHVLKESS